MKNLSFARNRLNALLRTQAFGAVGSLVPRITGMFVSGSVVGVVLSLMAIAAFCWLRDGTAIPEPAFEKGNAILNVSFRLAPERIGCNRAMFTFAQDPISKVTHTPIERTI